MASYESRMLDEFALPSRSEVEKALLLSLFKHGGVIKEFGSGEPIVDEIADYFKLDYEQRTAFLQTLYRKENRIKRSGLWHRLLFRAADSLARQKLVTRPSQTAQLTNRKEWMLTEDGFDSVLKLSNIPSERKASLPTKSYEVQKIVKKLTETPQPKNYDPFDRQKKTSKITKEVTLRVRGFRQAVIEAYDCKCSVCGLRIQSPDSILWEVEAAHIVPHSSLGRDDIWNGLALCHLHHWAFDVGWFALQNDYTIDVSPQIDCIPLEHGRLGEYEFIRSLSKNKKRISLPRKSELHPHQLAISWHRQNVFFGSRGS